MVSVFRVKLFVVFIFSFSVCRGAEEGFNIDETSYYRKYEDEQAFFNLMKGFESSFRDTSSEKTKEKIIRETSLFFLESIRRGYYFLVEYLVMVSKIPIEFNDLKSSKDGNTGLHIAALNSDPEIYLLLLFHFMDINVENKNGSTSYDLLSAKTEEEKNFNAQITIKKMIEDYKMRHQDLTLNEEKNKYYKWSPLHFAVAKLDQNSVLELVKRGANPFYENKKGMTPYDFLLLLQDKAREDELECYNERDMNMIGFYFSNFSIERRDRSERMMIYSIDTKGKDLEFAPPNHGFLADNGRNFFSKRPLEKTNSFIKRGSSSKENFNGEEGDMSENNSGLGINLSVVKKMLDPSSPRSPTGKGPICQRGQNEEQTTRVLLEMEDEFEKAKEETVSKVPKKRSGTPVRRKMSSFLKKRDSQMDN